MPADDLIWRRFAPYLALAVLLAAVPALFAGCGEPDASNSAVRELVILGGDNQTADADTNLPLPFHVQALGAGGRAVSGVTIRFSVLKGHGRMPESFIAANKNGEVRAQYTLGILPVENEVEAAAGDQRIVFHAKAQNLTPPVPLEKIKGFGPLEGLTFDNRGLMYVGTQSNGTIWQITPRFKFSQVATGLGKLLGLAVGTREEIYACDWKRNVILKVDPANGHAEDFATWFNFAGFAMPNGIAVPPNGDVYFSEGGGTRILRVGPEGHVSEFLTGLKQPNGIAFGPDGKTLYINELEAGRVLVVGVNDDGTAQVPIPFADHIPLPDGIALDRDGDVFVTSTVVNGLKVQNSLVLITPDGKSQVLFAAPDGKIFANIGFGRAGFDVGTLYLASWNGTLDAVYLGVDGLVIGGPALIH